MCRSKEGCNTVKAGWRGRGSEDGVILNAVLWGNLSQGQQHERRQGQSSVVPGLMAAASSSFAASGSCASSSTPFALPRGAANGSGDQKITQRKHECLLGQPVGDLILPPRSPRCFRAQI